MNALSSKEERNPLEKIICKQNRTKTPFKEGAAREEMATHFSICAWKISWTEEPGGLQSMGSQRVRHN